MKPTPWALAAVCLFAAVFTDIGYKKQIKEKESDIARLQEFLKQRNQGGHCEGHCDVDQICTQADTGGEHFCYQQCVTDDDCSECGGTAQGLCDPQPSGIHICRCFNL